MTSSNLAANHFIPFLFRILLCAVFVPVGWSGIMGLETFSGEDAAVLESLEVAPAPESPESEAPDAFEARRLYSLSILLAKRTLPRPVVTAWALTLVALAGGSLLLLGLFTRLWAFGLTTYMGLLFWCNSLDALQADSNIFQADASLLLHAGGILALGFIALSLIFTGAGALSLDQAIFAHHSSSQHDYEEEAEESE
jgi:uncharacterized membrane protein YphA (DoxX/SURF4 family)